jgi:hypothetical protein
MPESSTAYHRLCYRRAPVLIRTGSHLYDNWRTKPSLGPRRSYIFYAMPQSFFPKGRQFPTWPAGKEVALGPRSNIFYVMPQSPLPGPNYVPFWPQLRLAPMQKTGRDTEMHQEIVNSALVFYVSAVSPTEHLLLPPWPSKY